MATTYTMGFTLMVLFIAPATYVESLAVQTIERPCSIFKYYNSSECQGLVYFFIPSFCDSSKCTCFFSMCDDGLSLDLNQKCVKKDALGQVISRCDDCKLPDVCPTNQIKDFVQCKCVDASQATTTSVPQTTTTTTSVPQTTTTPNVSSALETTSAASDVRTQSPMFRKTENETNATPGRTKESDDIPVPTTSRAAIETTTGASMLATVLVGLAFM
jgi:hypothetical protein